MSTFQQYQQQFAGYLNAAITTPSTAATDSTDLIKELLTRLINSLPYFANPDWETAHRSVFANLLATSMPNAAIALPQPERQPYVSENDSYTGPCSGYQNAFFSQVYPTTAAGAVFKTIGKDQTWWGNFSVAVLADGIKDTIGISLNTQKLSNDLAAYNTALAPNLTATYLASFQSAFQPTANALNSLLPYNDGSSAAGILSTAVINGQFSANINSALSAGGDSTSAATFFLFNLWVAIKALNPTVDVDGCIKQAMTSGLDVPAEVQPGNWWNGSYISYFSPLCGKDILSLGNVGGMITADLPIMKAVSADYGSGGGGANIPGKISNGYSTTFCYNSSLNYYCP